MNYPHFTHALLQWYEQHGRKNLPWQEPYDAYRVWLSEIMLQQTQVKTVIPYFNKFVTQFPTIHHLANASEDEVLQLWAGLGYYSRARNLHKTAKSLVELFNGEFPQDLNQLIQFPGIGVSTAAAILSLAFNQPHAILDGNVKRVLSRYFLISGIPNRSETLKQLWEVASQCASKQSPRAYTQAIMDLGATCCTPHNPTCEKCPVNDKCGAFLTQRVKEYPEKSRKQKKTIRHQQFLLIHTVCKKIYLEKRPAHGIWGGLWCVPMIEQDECMSTYFTKIGNITPLEAKPLLKLKHVFTHFQLYIDAWQILVKKPILTLNNSAWFHPNELHTIGLPKAVKTLVEHWIQEDVN